MQPSSFKTAVNFGAMSGLSCFAIFILLYKMGINPLGPGSWMAIWIPPLFIFLGTRRFRNVELKGFISFGAAFRASFLTASSGALLYALLIYIFGTLIDPLVLDNFKEMMLTELEQTESMMRSVLGDSIYEKSIEEINNTTFKSMAMNDFFNKTIGGALFGLITAAILKRKSPEIQ